MIYNNLFLLIFVYSEIITPEQGAAMEVCENLEPLEVLVDTEYQTISQKLKGRRVVNLGYVLEKYSAVVKHSLRCTMGRMEFQKEFRHGLHSKLVFYCDNCEQSMTINTEPPEAIKTVNSTVVWGSLSTGLGHNQCEELFGVLDIPFMTAVTFARQTAIVKKVGQVKYVNLNC